MRILLSSLNSTPWLAEALAARGLEVAALHAARVDLGDFGFSVPQPPADGSYTLHTLPVFPLRPYPYSRYRGPLGRILRDLQPDIVYHLGEPSELNTAQVVRAARRHCPQARQVLFTFENVLRDWRGFPRCLRGRAERTVLPRLDRVAACSHSAKAVLEARGVAPERIRVLYQAVSGDFSAQPDPALRRELCPDDCFLVGYVGRLVHEKAVDVLLRALALLPPHFALCAVGGGREAEALAALAEELGLAGRVTWLGRVPREQMARTLSTFDALVLPSRSIPTWQEQFGAVLVEAMFCETPVIGSSSGAIPEVIGDAGLVFPEEDAAALAERLRGLQADEALRRQLGQAGRQRALREFSVEVYVERLLGLFEEALQG